MVFASMADNSSLKQELVSGLDIMILRELTGGVYFCEPRGIEDLPGGGKRGFDTQAYSTPAIERIGRVAFDLARKRRSKVTSVETANVMTSVVLWRAVMRDLHKRVDEGRAYSNMFADTSALLLSRPPPPFHVILTT